MPAKKGNQYWLKRSKENTGRKPIFKNPDEIWKCACRYFRWVEDNPIIVTDTHFFNGHFIAGDVTKTRPFTLEGLVDQMDITREMWGTFRKNKDFSDIVFKIDNIIFENQYIGAATGAFNHNIVSRRLGLIDKQETEIKGELKTKSISLEDLQNEHDEKTALIEALENKLRIALDE